MAAGGWVVSVVGGVAVDGAGTGWTVVGAAVVWSLVTGAGVAVDGVGVAMGAGAGV